jgi:hypothetical protein
MFSYYKYTIDAHTYATGHNVFIEADARDYFIRLTFLVE